MSIQIERIALSAQPGAAEVAALTDMLASCGRVTLLVPSFGVRDTCRRALADAGCGVGVDVTTPDGWVQGLWELLGDGRRPVSGTQRRLLMARALAECTGHTVPSAVSGSGDGSAAHRGLSNTPGTVAMLAHAARSYLPYIEERAASADLSAAERQMARVLGCYAELLAANGLVEGSRAAVELARMVREGLPACARGVVLRGVRDLPEYLMDLLAAVAGEGDVRIVLEREAASEAAELARRLGVPEARGAAPHRAASGAVPGSGPACPSSAASVPVRFAEVCGPSARDAAYTQLITSVAGLVRPGAEGGPAPVAAASPDPLALFRALAPRLAAAGVPSSVEARVPFRSTRAGQALAMLADLLERLGGEEASAWWPAPEVPDWIRSPFSGLSSAAPRIARMLDTRLRKTRSLTKQALMGELESLQSRDVNRERALADREGRTRRPIAVKAVVDAVDAHRYARALQLMAECAAAAPASAFGAEGLAAKQAELAALESARSFMDEARALGVTEDQAFLVLPELAVRVAARTSPGAVPAGREPGADPGPAAGEGADGLAPAVSFRSLDALASEAPARHDVVFLLDADAASYPLAERDTPLTVLAGKLSCTGVSAKPAERQRASFRQAGQSARAAVLAYVARDRQAEGCYPALAYAEAREAARTAPEPPREAAGGASGLVPGILDAFDRAIAGLPHEGALFANLDRAGGAGAGRRVVSVQGEHVLPDELDRYLLLPERSLGSHAVPRTLSASQIENYLSCPYRWLVSNRASARRLDVGFGPIEMGNFVHDVMQRFHERLIDAGLMRVRPDTVDACLEQMDLAFEEIRADHERGKYTHGKYAREERPRAVRGALVALDELERNRLEAMLPKLHEVVRYEADMLSIFMPSQFEYSFDKEGVTYAGRPLGGRIDRIDTAPDAGSGERFVVIDYKNRASVRELACDDPTMALDEGEHLPEAWLPGRDADRAPKIQTLVYAQALERMRGGSAQGAVYFATRGPQVAGAVADALVASEPPAFPHDAVSGYPGVRPPRSRTAKHDGALEFQQLLDAVEAGVARELDALERGAVAPRPASDSCSFCPIAMCERRRS